MKNPADIVTDDMCLPISRSEAKAQIAKLQKHLDFTPEELREQYLVLMEKHHPEMYKSSVKHDDLPSVEWFE